MTARATDGLTRNQRYYRKHKVRLRDWLREYFRRHPEIMAAKNKRFYIRHASELRKKALQRSLNRTRDDDYRAKDRLAKSRRRAALGTVTLEEWRAICAQFDHRCAYCHRLVVPLEQDHVVPISRGGSHTPDNIVPACKPCNSSKGNRVPSRSPRYK